MVNFFKEWEQIKDKLKKRPLFIFLDFDGTLAPIAKTPAKAVIPEETKRILKILSRKAFCKVAVISGRSLVDIRAKLNGLNDVIYSGNHGLEIDGPGIKSSPMVSLGYIMAIKRIKIALGKMTSVIKGALLEDKKFSLSLHYRLVSDKQVPRLKEVFNSAVTRYAASGRVQVREGKKVLEVGPPSKWDKGKVVQWLLSRHGFAKRGKNILPVYIGDDLTDEDAFKALKNRGITIFVGRRNKSSNAKYYLRDTGDVARFLNNISEIQN